MTCRWRIFSKSDIERGRSPASSHSIGDVNLREWRAALRRQGPVDPALSGRLVRPSRWLVATDKASDHGDISEHYLTEQLGQANHQAQGQALSCGTIGRTVQTARRMPQGSALAESGTIAYWQL